MIKRLLYLLLILFSIFLLNLFVFKNMNNISFPSQQIFAEDDEKEDEEEEKKEEGKEDEEDEDGYEEITIETITEEVDTPENIIGTPITKTVNLIEQGYNIDTDGDKLVDALDPDPAVPQWEYYTDDDGDTVPNVKDKHKDEDDLLYFDFSDENNNGIIDLFETN